MDRALHHFQESIRYKEAAGNIVGAGETRYNAAGLLAQHGRFSDALLYARAALTDYERFGPRAANRIVQVHELIAAIKADLSEQEGGGNT